MPSKAVTILPAKPIHVFIEKVILLRTCPPSSGRIGSKLKRFSKALNTARPAKIISPVIQYKTVNRMLRTNPKNGPMMEITTSCQRVFIFSSLSAKPPKNGMR